MLGSAKPFSREVVTVATGSSYIVLAKLGLHSRKSIKALTISTESGKPINLCPKLVGMITAFTIDFPEQSIDSRKNYQFSGDIPITDTGAELRLYYINATGASTTITWSCLIK